MVQYSLTIIGIINYLPPKLKQALLNKSFFDFYSDLVYYPKITKLIKIFIMPLITKPQPEELFNEFQELPEKMKQAISTKGILHLLPNKIQNIVLKTDEVLPSQNYGKIDRSWYYQQEYQKQKEKRMLKKQRSYIKQYAIRKIQNKKWHNYILISILTIVLSQKLKNFQLKKLLNKRLFECGAIILIISLVMTFIKIRTEKKRKNNELRND